MLSGLALTAVVASAGVKLATVGFSGSGLSESRASFFAEHFAVQLARVDGEVRVSTPRDLAAVLGVERQRALLACGDGDASCMTELAGALGVDGLVTGQVARVGDRYQVNIKVLSPDGSGTLFVYSSKLLPSEEAVVEALNAAAPLTVAGVRSQLQRPGANVTAPAAASRPQWYPLLPAAAGVVALGVSAWGFLTALGQYQRLNSSSNWATLTEPEAFQLANAGKGSVTVGSLFALVGGALLLAGLLWFLLS